MDLRELWGDGRARRAEYQAQKSKRISEVGLEAYKVEQAEKAQATLERSRLRHGEDVVSVAAGDSEGSS